MTPVALSSESEEEEHGEESTLEEQQEHEREKGASKARIVKDRLSYLELLEVIASCQLIIVSSRYSKEDESKRDEMASFSIKRNDGDRTDGKKKVVSARRSFLGRGDRPASASAASPREERVSYRNKDRYSDSARDRGDRSQARVRDRDRESGSRSSSNSSRRSNSNSEWGERRDKESRRSRDFHRNSDKDEDERPSKAVRSRNRDERGEGMRIECRIVKR